MCIYAKQHPEVLSTPPVEAFFMGFGDSALNFQVRAWVARGDRWISIKMRPRRRRLR